MHWPITFAAAAPSYYALVVITLNGQRTAVRYMGASGPDAVRIYVDGCGAMDIPAAAEWDHA